MCSLTESELEPELVKTRLDPSKILVCKKCKENKPSVNLRVNDAYCKECFLSGVHHKFRATLGKHKAMKPGDKVCVAYSGGVASSALLHLLKTGIESDHKKLLFRPEVLHVDEGSLFQLSTEERLANIRNRVREASVYGFLVHFCLLEDPSNVVSLSHPVPEDFIPQISIQENAAKSLFDSIQSIKENSAKEDFISSLRRRAIVEGAKAMKCGKVFTGENSTKISIDLLSGVSMGKGINLAHETGFRDTRDDVLVLRPLRDISGKELAVYTQFHRLQCSPGPNIATGKDSLFSIRKLTEDFLVGLQADFPATLSTVFRTGDKLQVDEEPSSETCVLCEGPLDTDTEDHCALQATYWSLIVSSKGKNLDEKMLSSDQLHKLNLDTLRSETSINCDTSSSDCCGEGDGSCKSSRPLRLQEILPFLCYSCMRTVTSCKNLEQLPASFLDEVRRKRNRSEMKSEIKDFLL